MMVIISSLAIYVAKKEGNLLPVEFGKLALSLSTVFLGVFLAQYSNNLYNVEREKQHILKLLRVSHNELESFNAYLQAIPTNFLLAKKQIKNYEPSDLFKDNSLELPFIVDTTLTDTNIIRTMHPQSISAILASLENSKKMLRTLNQKEISEHKLQNLVGVSTTHLTSLTKYIEYEIKYQLGVLSQEELFDLHRAHIKHLESNPINSLIKVK